MSVLVIGQVQDHEVKSMLHAAERAGADCMFSANALEAVRLVEEMEEPPWCIFVTLSVDVATLLEFLRGSSTYYSVPVIALVEYPGSDSYLAANRLGVDDSIPRYDSGGMTRRIANLMEGQAPRLPSPDAGRVIVAMSDVEGRRTVGRKLRAAGYEVEFVAEEQELRARSQAEKPLSLVVSTPSFLPGCSGGALEVARRESRAASLPGVFLSSRTADDGRDPGYGGDVTNLLFLVDEATRPAGTNKRSSKRIQHAEIATFRTTRTFEPTYALTDNISRQGLYLRTMDPPTIGSEVRIDLRDEFGDVLELHGTVAWRHAPSKVGGTTCPGFGVRIDESQTSATSLQKYTKMYDTLLESITACPPRGEAPLPPDSAVLFPRQPHDRSGQLEAFR